jgi:cell division protein FtsI/penicillin-binding protein 2
MTTPAQTRALTVILLFACGFTAISARLIHLQLVRHDYSRGQALRMHTDVVPLAPKRGSVLDARGRILAQTVTVTDLRIDGKLASERPEEVAAAAAALGWSTAQLAAYIQPGARYQLLVNDLPEPIEQELRRLKMKSLIFVERSLRVYPNAHEGSHVIGFANAVPQRNPAWKLPIDVETGMDGMERVMDAYLRGVPGERRIVRDARRKEIAGYRQADLRPRNGLNVILTLDQGVQHIIEKEADRLVREFQPAAVHIIVMRPATGEILGLTNRPTFDPNDRSTMTPTNLRNSAVQDVYEPWASASPSWALRSSVKTGATSTRVTNSRTSILTERSASRTPSLNPATSLSPSSGRPWARKSSTGTCGNSASASPPRPPPRRSSASSAAPCVRPATGPRPR